VGCGAASGHGEGAVEVAEHDVGQHPVPNHGRRARRRAMGGASHEERWHERILTGFPVGLGGTEQCRQPYAKYRIAQSESCPPPRHIIGSECSSPPDGGGCTF